MRKLGELYDLGVEYLLQYNIDLRGLYNIYINLNQN